MGFFLIRFRIECLVLDSLLRVTGNSGLTPEKEPERRLLHLRKAAGAQISQCSMSEEVTNINKLFSIGRKYWNDYNLQPLRRINWRASLVPAAAVIPAPIVDIKIVAVEKLVVEILGSAVLMVYVQTYLLRQAFHHVDSALQFFVKL